ncbi:MAG: biotin/lipoyl-binding protein [Anaerolineae bacterium]|nr:biotin/lipoyl-binding protein [Anaerolineae bacterium]MCB0178361.1 biotin/lipoyl-binding protein [Anaerolineae bacterium]MCB0226507.1 biotin/lipoyl-binding protein [Anaerolineae bacterium]MCB9104189.1 biotin/lipoyl-binding protein [Anaerolineales bacterium]
MKYVTTVGDQQYTIDINKENEIVLDGEVINADMQQMPDTLMYSIIIDGKSHDVRLSEGDGVYVVQLGGQIYEVVVEDERTRRLAGLKGNVALTGEAILKAPMPGVVVEVPVTTGQEVAQGDIVIVLESMKMQNEFKAPRAGTVHMIYVAAGDKVEQNDTMITIS